MGAKSASGSGAFIPTSVAPITFLFVKMPTGDDAASGAAMPEIRLSHGAQKCSMSAAAWSIVFLPTSFAERKN